MQIFAMFIFLIVAHALVFGSELNITDTGLAQQVPSESVTHLAKPDINDSEPSKFTFKFGDEKYIVLSNGKGTRIRSGHRSEKFVLPVVEGRIEQLHYALFGEGLVLIYQLTDGDSGWTDLLCLGRKTLKSKWRNEMNGFNVGQGLIEDSFLYITSIGIVAKLDLRSGKYVWKHDKLYKPFKPDSLNSSRQEEPAHFNAFELPHLEGEFVLFTEALYCPSRFTEKDVPSCLPMTLRVNKHTGQIMAEDPIVKER